ncbi:hypothetical protein GD627_10970 [Arthrobacter yangruifuii]|uniref:DUF4190 domain-containing protein n=1 Tax=Arthrobacter yangruifuii TaxID=2606616 RepID=A0A5N6MH91_9MICC|nr:hypothetical protein [Arthrobacter yangruifuii]KAD3514845.1 hypothetical protein GD627_10970 [Arthrobacter yangruifuii]
MSENRPEWQPGADPAGNDKTSSDSGQYGSAPASGTPEEQETTAYPSYGQQQDSQPEANPYSQPEANPYSQPEANPYGQQQDSQPEANPYGQQAAYPGYGQDASAYSQPAGYPAYGQDGYPQPQVNPGQAMGIAGLITSFFISVVGLVLSIIGLNQSRKAGMGNVPAVAGIIIGGLGTLVGVVFFIFIMIAIMSSSSSYSY